jgi:hypothetical protein
VACRLGGALRSDLGLAQMDLPGHSPGAKTRRRYLPFFWLPVD